VPVDYQRPQGRAMRPLGLDLSMRVPDSAVTTLRVAVILVSLAEAAITFGARLSATPPVELSPRDHHIREVTNSASTVTA
jgi:hypothetical protein